MAQQLRDYQDAVLANIRQSLGPDRRKMVSIHAPPGWGRTAPALVLVKEALESGRRVAWVLESREKVCEIGHMIPEPEGISWAIVESWADPPSGDVLLTDCVPYNGWFGFDAGDFLILEKSSSLATDRDRGAVEKWPGQAVWFSSMRATQGLPC